MNIAEAAQRLGVDQRDVTEVRDHDDGHLVVLVDRQVVINRAGTQYPYRGHDDADEGDEAPTGDEEAAEPKPAATKTRRARRPK